MALIPRPSAKAAPPSKPPYHSQQVTSRAYTLLDLLVNTDSNLRAGLVTGQPTLFGSTTEMAQDLLNATQRLHELVQDNVEQCAVIERVTTRVQQKIAPTSSQSTVRETMTGRKKENFPMTLTSDSQDR